MDRFVFVTIIIIIIIIIYLKSSNCLQISVR